MKILSIAKFDLKKMFRDKTALLFVILLPLIFTFVMGLVFGGISDSEGTYRTPIGIADLSQGEYAQKLMEEIKKENSLRVKEIDENFVFDEVESGEITVGFIIPSEYDSAIKNGQIPEIKTVKLPTSAEFVAVQSKINAAFRRAVLKEQVLSYLDETLDAAHISDRAVMLEDAEKSLGEKLEGAPLITVKETKFIDEKKSTQYDGKAQTSIGYLVMFVMFNVVFAAGEILEEKKDNTWGRLNITPTGKSTIMLGKIVGTFLRGWFQIAFLILFGRFVLGVSWGNSLISTILLGSVFVISVTGIGIFMASIVKTNAQLGAFGSIIVMCTTMVSGCWWPIDMQPVIMQKIAVVFPQYWAMKGFTNTVVGNMGLSSIVTPLLALTVIGVFFFSASVVIARMKERTFQGMPTKRGLENHV